MARGWESKSVEDQIHERESSAQAASAPKVTPEEIQRRSKRDGLQVVRTRTLTALQSVCDTRHRAHLERVLADIEAQLKALDDSNPDEPAV
jgi:hypothetical protein